MTVTAPVVAPHGIPVVQFAYRATILEWHDGDTVKLEVDQGFEDFKKSWFRLFGVDTPELATDAGKAALKAVEERWPAGTTLTVVSVKGENIPVGKEKYGRWLADLYPAGSTGTVSQWLIANGYGTAYFGGKKGVVAP